LVEMSFNIPSKEYSILVTPPSGVPVTIGRNFLFRTEQSSVETLNNLGFRTLHGDSHSIKDVSVIPGNVPVRPSPPTGLRVR
jgi:hypothetical protein